MGELRARPVEQPRREGAKSQIGNAGFGNSVFPLRLCDFVVFPFRLFQPYQLSTINSGPSTSEKIRPAIAVCKVPFEHDLGM